MSVENICSILLPVRSCCYVGYADVDLDFSVASFP